ncbi:MAG: hypothetical protein COB62_05735 [Piscirickettsiaceae bacterium]|nr:MAG: hypothetical protein COB62_05735 [Piscirickettsiaceae bacterium]
MFKHPITKKTSELDGMKRINLTLKKNQQYLQKVQQQLPKNLANHCIHVVFNKNKLTLYTDSSIWASKLLYQRIQIIDAISKSFCEPVQSLSVRVVNEQLKLTIKKPIKPSAQTINNFALSTIHTSQKNDVLNTALNKLIKVLKG